MHTQINKHENTSIDYYRFKHKQTYKHEFQYRHYDMTKAQRI